jgi:hypothetical protein
MSRSKFRAQPFFQVRATGGLPQMAADFMPWYQLAYVGAHGIRGAHFLPAAIEYVVSDTPVEPPVLRK